MAFSPKPRKAGDLIKCEEWNELLTEVERLGQVTDELKGSGGDGKPTGKDASQQSQQARGGKEPKPDEGGGGDFVKKSGDEMTGKLAIKDQLEVEKESCLVGKVLIGKKGKPASTLDVDGCMTVRNEGDNSAIMFKANNGKNAQIGVQDDSDMGWYVHIGGRYSFVVNQNGSVGVGCGTAKDKLHVNKGHIRVRNDGAVIKFENSRDNKVWQAGIQNGDSAFFLFREGNPNSTFYVHPSCGTTQVHIKPRSVEVWNANFRVNGGAKHFVIDHPNRPGRKLVHASLEGPEAGVYYRGEGTLADGRAEVRLPGYFEKLTRPDGRTITLTGIGPEPFRLSATRIADGRFQVFGERPEASFYWEVKAIRNDIPPVEVEPLA